MRDSLQVKCCPERVDVCCSMDSWDGRNGADTRQVTETRHAAVLAAIAAGSYPPSNVALCGRRDGNPLPPKPVL